jgi:hypothetical protein
LTNALTIAELEAMPDDGRRYELMDGSIVATAPPGLAHQRVSRRLLSLLEAAGPPGHEVFDAHIDLDLPGEQRVQPDLVVVPLSSVGGPRRHEPQRAAGIGREAADPVAGLAPTDDKARGWAGSRTLGPTPSLRTPAWWPSLPGHSPTERLAPPGSSAPP